MELNEEQHAVELVAERLQTRFPSIDPQTISATVAECHEVYDGRPIRDFVPVLVEREARERLRLLPGQREPQAS